MYTCVYIYILIIRLNERVTTLFSTVTPTMTIRLTGGISMLGNTTAQSFTAQGWVFVARRIHTPRLRIIFLFILSCLIRSLNWAIIWAINLTIINNKLQQLISLLLFLVRSIFCRYACKLSMPYVNVWTMHYFHII